MTLEQIRNLYDAQPFRPFTLRLADGGHLEIRSRGFIMVPPQGRTLPVWDPNSRAIRLIDLLLVTEAVIPDGNGTSRRPPRTRR